MVDLKKHIEPGSLRHKGLLASGLAPTELPIAGKSRESILSAMRCDGFAVGRVSPANAFVARAGEAIHYLFVRPEYGGYRRIAQARFGGIPAGYDVDHVHARNLAAQFGYQYVLVVLVPLRVNRQHGLYEQIRSKLEEGQVIPEVCFADERIFDKILQRSPRSRRSEESLRKGYDPHAPARFGLTLKQRGLWNRSFGFDRVPSEEFTRKLKPLDNRL